MTRKTFHLQDTKQRKYNEGNNQAITRETGFEVVYNQLEKLLSFVSNLCYCATFLENK